MHKNKKQKQTRGKSTRSSRHGVRNELLPGDGKTFTALTALPKAVMPRPRTYTISQSYEALSPFTTSTSLNSFLSYTVSLGAVDQSSSLAQVFDQYRIIEAELWLMPRASAAASNSDGGILSSVIDLDDATLLTQLNQAGDYSSCITSEPTVGHYRRWVPHAAIAAYSGAFTSFANVASPWCDTSYPSVTHYGVKLAASVTAVALVYDINVRLKLQFRSVR